MLTFIHDVRNHPDHWLRQVSAALVVIVALGVLLWACAQGEVDCRERGGRVDYDAPGGCLMPAEEGQ